MAAVANENREILQILLEAGADPNIGGPGGLTALLVSIVKPAPELMQDLLHTGKADPNIASTAGVTPLMAAASGNSEAVGPLLEAGADVNAQDRNGMTALHMAAARGDAEVARALLAWGANPRLESTKGITAHDFATDGGHMDVVRVIEEYLEGAGRVQ
jgi:ankyrin repeat protein